MTFARRSVLFSAALACLFARAATAQPSGEKTLIVSRAPAPPAIDGRIDAGEWAAATVIEDFHQVEPVEFASPSERTRVYVMIDADNIYVAARMWDREPDQVAARSMRQGEELNDDDVFGVALDTFNDRRNGYWFAVNPNGVRRQAIFQNTTTRNFDWRGIWHTMSSRDSEGWVTEIAIPVKTLTFNPDSDTWGINFRRKIERRQEFMAWVSRNRQVNPSASGIATGMTGFNQGIGLDLVPSVSLKQQRTFDPANTDRSVEPSLDVFYKITPALTAALTINTDFSATEVDDREVNLTRFGLFFPEKRLLPAGCGYLRVRTSHQYRQRYRDRRQLARQWSPLFLSTHRLERKGRTGRPRCGRQNDGPHRQLERRTAGCCTVGLWAG